MYTLFKRLFISRKLCTPFYHLRMRYETIVPIASLNPAILRTVGHPLRYPLTIPYDTNSSRPSLFSPLRPRTQSIRPIPLTLHPPTPYLDKVRRWPYLHTAPMMSPPRLASSYLQTHLREQVSTRATFNYINSPATSPSFFYQTTQRHHGNHTHIIKPILYPYPCQSLRWHIYY